MSHEYANNGAELVLFLLAFIILIVRTSGAKREMCCRIEIQSN